MILVIRESGFVAISTPEQKSNRGLQTRGLRQAEVGPLLIRALLVAGYEGRDVDRGLVRPDHGLDRRHQHRHPPESGVDVVSLPAWPMNHAARPSYERQGFFPSGILPGLP